MKLSIGKYKIIQDSTSLKIRYVYSVSDFIGGLLYLCGSIFGMFIIFISIEKFDDQSLYDIGYWFVFVIGICLLFLFSYLLILGLYNPIDGVLQINKETKEIVIRDFLKKETVDLRDYRKFTCDIVESYRPKQKHGMFKLITLKGQAIDCFIIRSPMPIDLGRKIDRDIFDTAKRIKKVVHDFMVND